MIAFTFQPDWGHNLILLIGFFLICRALSQDFASMRQSWKFLSFLALLWILVFGRWTARDYLTPNPKPFHRPESSTWVEPKEADKVLFQIFIYNPKNAQLLLAEEKLVDHPRPLVMTMRSKQAREFYRPVSWPDIPRLNECDIPQPIGIAQQRILSVSTRTWTLGSISSGELDSWKPGPLNTRWSTHLQAKGKGGKHGRSSELIYLPLVTYLEPDEKLVESSVEELRAQFPQLAPAQTLPKPERRFYTWNFLFGDTLLIFLFCPALIMTLKQRSPWQFLRALAVGLFVLLILELYLKARDPSALTWFLR